MRVKSHLEMVGLHHLVAHPDTVINLEQQDFEWHDRGGKGRRHYFDMLVETRSGVWTVCAVRSAARIDIAYLDRLSLIRNQAIDAGFVVDVRFLTETSFDAITRHNATLLHGSSHPDLSVV